MATRLILLATILVLVPVVSPLLVSTGTAETSSACSTAEHDVFRTEEAIETYNRSGEAISSESNTDVRLEESTGFVRVHAKNPNGYCVKYVVEISREIIAPADIGTVDSNNESVKASWRAAQNLSSGVVYTRIEFTLEPGANATFAPSTVRIQSLSWTGEAKARGSGVLSEIRGLFGEGDLEKRHYSIEANGSSRITVPLENEDGQEIEEWKATYTLEGETRPVTQDADAPVFYTESGSGVTFHFNNQEASVEFIANPSFLEKAEYSGRSYWSGIAEGLDVWPFGTIRGGTLA